MTFQLPKRRKRERFNSRDDGRYRSEPYMQWVRGHECCIAGKAGHVCSGKIEAHHVRLGTDGGASLKPSDWWCVPLCSGAHSELHGPGCGQATFDKRYQIDCKAVAAGLWRSNTTHRIKYERSKETRP